MNDAPKEGKRRWARVCDVGFGCRWPLPLTTVAKFGTCCGCGYSGEEESECPAYYDQTHCNHWWDGKEE